MRHEEGFFRAQDGLELYHQSWLPDHDPRARVILLHGFTEHGGRYGEVAKALAGHGFAVHAPDLRGHGRSAGERAFVRSFDEFVADLEVFAESVRRRQPHKPLFLFGHSMGGTIALRYVAARQPDVQGLIVSAPAVMVGEQVFPILRRLAWLVSRLFPRLKIVRMGLGWVSRDPEVVTQFRSDPLVFHDRFPVRIAAEILQAARRVQEDAAAIRLPLLVLQGTGDRIVSTSGAKRLVQSAAASDRTLRLYEGLYHDLLHEPEKEEVIGDMIAWVNRHC